MASTDMQWLFYSGERIVTHGYLVFMSAHLAYSGILENFLWPLTRLNWPKLLCFAKKKNMTFTVHSNTCVSIYYCQGLFLFVRESVLQPLF